MVYSTMVVWETGLQFGLLRWGSSCRNLMSTSGWNHIAGYDVDRKISGIFSGHGWYTTGKKKFTIEGYANHMSVSYWSSACQMHMFQRSPVNEIRITGFETYLSALSCYRTAVKSRHTGGCSWWWRSKTAWAVTTDNIAVVQEIWWSMMQQLARNQEGRKHKLCALQRGIPRRLSKKRLGYIDYPVLSFCVQPIYPYLRTRTGNRKCTSRSYWCGEGGTRDARLSDVQDLRWVPFFVPCDHNTTERALYRAKAIFRTMWKQWCFGRFWMFITYNKIMLRIKTSWPCVDVG